MKSIRTILFPTDFSALSDKALSFAIEVAYRMNAQLSIFHAYEIPLAVEQGTGTMHPPMIDAEQIAQQHFRELHRFPQLNKVRYETITRAGPLPEALESLLDTKHIDLIVMGTTGAEGLKEVLMGTHTADVIKKIDVPVLAIPEEWPGGKIQNVAFAYDYKGIPEPNELNVLKDIVTNYKAELFVLHISESMEPRRDEDFKSLEIIDKKFWNANRYFKIHLSDDVERGIREYVTNNSINMLAVMPREHGFFDKLFKKSITEKLTFHANVPLLVLNGN